MARKNITAERLRELLHYDPITGLFTRLNGKTVGGTHHSRPNREYLLLCINGDRYYAHRLAWLYMTGDSPCGQIDHINGNRLDNRFCNLRDVTNATNQQNLRSPKANNKLGVLGVRILRSGRFQARIKVNGKILYLGTYDTIERAKHEYLCAKRQHHEGCTI